MPRPTATPCARSAPSWAPARYSSNRTAPGKTARSNASTTVQTEWAYKRVFDPNAHRAAALASWSNHYNTQRRHSALGGLPPISRLTPTS